MPCPAFARPGGSCGPAAAFPRRPGRGPRRHGVTRLGVLVPSGNPTIEPELYRMAPRAMTIHFARLESLAGEPGAADGMERRTLAYLDSVPAAIHSMEALRLGVVVLAHTAVSYLSGFKAEPALLERIASLSGARPLTAATAIAEALRHLGARRL